MTSSVLTSWFLAQVPVHKEDFKTQFWFFLCSQGWESKLALPLDEVYFHIHTRSYYSLKFLLIHEQLKHNKPRQKVVVSEGLYHAISALISIYKGKWLLTSISSNCKCWMSLKLQTLARVNSNWYTMRTSGNAIELNLFICMGTRHLETTTLQLRRFENVV